MKPLNQTNGLNSRLADQVLFDVEKWQTWNYFVHESSYVDDPSSIGVGDKDLAFLPRNEKLANRRELQYRSERGQYLPM